MFFSSIGYKILPPIIKNFGSLKFVEAVCSTTMGFGKLSLICDDIEDKGPE